MDTQGSYIINNKHFSREELVLFSESKLASTQQDDWEYDLYRFILDFFDEKVAIEQKTSGTTGDPKSLFLDRKSMHRSASMTIRHFDLSPGDKVLLCLPVKFIAGKMMVVRALSGGLNLITGSPSGRPLENMEDEIQFAAMVPMQVSESIAHRDPLDKLQKLLIGGGEIGSQLLTSIRKLKNLEVYESFAMSETYSHFATRLINGASPAEYFKPMEGVSIDTDERSCLLVSYPGVTKGGLQSNDLVELRGTNEFKWLGRIDNVIESGGIKYVPELMEQKIEQIIPFSSLIIGLPDTKLGSKMVLLVEAQESDLRREMWMEEMKKSLQKFEVPREIIAVDALPRNSAQKYDRLAAIKMMGKSGTGSIRDLVNTPFKKAMFIIQILSYFLIVLSPVIGGALGAILKLSTAKTGGLILGVFILGEVFFYGSLIFLGKEIVLLIRGKLKEWFRKRKRKV